MGTRVQHASSRRRRQLREAQDRGGERRERQRHVQRLPVFWYVVRLCDFRSVVTGTCVSEAACSIHGPTTPQHSCAYRTD